MAERVKKGNDIKEARDAGQGVGGEAHSHAVCSHPTATIYVFVLPSLVQIRNVALSQLTSSCNAKIGEVTLDD